MGFEPICGGKFLLGHGVICLPVSFNNVPDQIIFNKKIFVINTFLHVSVVGIKKIIEKYNISIPDFEAAVLSFEENNEEEF